MPKENQNSESKKQGIDEAIRYHAQLAVAEAELRKKLSGSRNRGLKEVAKFGITTVAIFALSFSALNFSAYKKQTFFWLENLRADVIEETASTPKLEVKEIEEISNQKVELPPILTEISPPDNRIVIPKFDVFAPIVEAENVDVKKSNWEEIESQVQEALKNGVVHFPGSAKIGEKGNAFLTGHSSYYPWSDGRYKDVFALLPKIEIGDEIVIWENQQKFVYRVSEISEVNPAQTDVMEATEDNRLTLMTCTPVGTSLKRLIVTAQLVK